MSTEPQSSFCSNGERENEPPRLAGIPSPRAGAEAVAAGRLLTLGLMTSRACDLRCVYCYTAAGRAGRNELRGEDRLRVLREGAELGVRLLWIPGAGEPLLDPGFWPLLEEARKLGIWTLFYTSGTQITPEVAERIAALPCSVVVKVNSLQPAAQDAITGVEGSYRAIHRGIDLLLDAGLHEEGRLGAETVIMPATRDELPSVLRFCRQRRIIPYIERMLPAGRGRAQSLRMDFAAEARVLSTLADIDRQEFGFSWTPHGTFATGLWDCDRILYTIVVDAQGFAHPCVAISEAFGNLREQSLERIWKGKRMQSLRSGLAPQVGQGVCYCRQSLGEGRHCTNVPNLPEKKRVA